MYFLLGEHRFTYCVRYLQMTYCVMYLQMTVKKTLSDFRRTHHDNWHDHKQMFTDDQLVVLTDLLISPNYYA